MTVRVSKGAATPAVLDLDGAMQGYLADNQKTWMYDRKLTVGGSEVFGCQRQNFFKKRGDEFGYAKDDNDPDPWGATERGNVIESWIAPMLGQSLPKGAKLLWAGKEQNTLVSGRNSSTPDGLFVGLPKAPLKITIGGKEIDIPDFADSDGSLVLEIKSIDPRAHLAEERAKHRGQCQVAIGLVRETTEYKPKHALIIYINASFLNDITPFLVTFDPGTWKAAQKRAPVIWEHDEPGAFEPEGKYTGDCDHCKYRNACGEAVLSEWAKTDANPKDTPDVIEAVREEVEDLIEIQAQFKALERDFKEAQQRVKDALIAKNARRVRSDDWSVSWTTQNGSKKVDYKTAFAKYGIDVDEYTTQGAGFDVLRVTPKDKGFNHDD